MADGKVVIDTELNEKGLKSGLSGLGQKAAGAISGVAKVATAAGAAAAAGVVAITKKAVAAFSEYEQLVGGVETLFKDSSAAIMEYANNAYMTAGMSANQYMETVTSFSASLLQSLGGDTAKAAQYADRAVIDMSDNANKMGTAIESIQWAYQGFAKQNFSMLDNLKLGYGGTKQEMERLIHDASQMTDIQKELNTAVNDGDMSFANIVNAIHVMQASLGILGTTEKEAATTIQGSLKMTQASWENLLVALADPAGNVDDAVDKFVSSLETLGENALPIIDNALSSIAGMLDRLAPKIAEKLPAIIPPIISSLLNAAHTIVSSLIKNLPMILSSIWQSLTEQGNMGALKAIGVMMLASRKISSAVMGIFAPIGGVIGKAIFSKVDFSSATGMITSKMSGLIAPISGVFSKLGSSLLTFATGPVGIVIGVIGALIAAFITLYNTNEDFRNSMNELGASIMESLAPIGEAFMNMINEITPVLAQLGSVLGDAFASLIETVAPMITSIVEALVPLITMLAETLIPVIQNVLNAVIPVVTTIVEAVVPVIQTIISAIAPIITTLIDILTPAIQFLVGVISGIISVLSPIIEFIAGAVTTAINTVIGIIQMVIQILTGDFEGAAATFRGILDGIWSFWSSVWNNIVNFFTNIWNNITSFLGNAMTNMGNAVSDGVQNVINWFAGLPGRIMNALGNLGNLLVDAGKNIINGFLNGLKAAFDGVKNFIGGIGEWIASHKGPKQYDLNLLKPHGGWIMGGFGKSLDKEFEKIKKRIRDYAPEIQKEFEISMDDMNVDVTNSLGNIIAMINLNSDMLQAKEETKSPVEVNQNFYNMNTTVNAVGREMRKINTYGHYGLAGVYG